jgi:rhodanese-related sulfurtransferase
MVREEDPQSCFDMLAADSSALLVDCRSQKEWDLIGTPDLSQMGKKTLLVEWNDGDNQRNPNFIAQISRFAAHDTPIIMMCRIGGRSAAACHYLAEQGFTNLTNMAEGFEGRVDEAGHRNSFEGWRARNLPWRQS